MQNIKIDVLIKRYGWDRDEIAGVLFPLNKFPVLALRRISKGDAVLDSAQLLDLSKFTGVPISDLFSASEWVSEVVEGQLIFKCGDYRAILNRQTWVTRLIEGADKLVDEFLLSPALTVPEYIANLDEKILNVISE